MSVLACCVIVSDEPEVDSLVFKDLVVELEVPVLEFEVLGLELDACPIDALAFEGLASLFNDLGLELEAPVAEFEVSGIEFKVGIEFDALAFDILVLVFEVLSLYNDLVLKIEAPEPEFEVPVLEFDALPIAFDILAALAFGGLLVLLLLDLV